MAVCMIAVALVAGMGCHDSGPSDPSGGTHVDIGTNRPDTGVAFGDSISHGRDSLLTRSALNDAGPDEPGYRVRLEELFAADGRVLHMIEDGEPGSESSDGVARIQRAIDTRPAFLVLLYGTNDAFMGRPAAEVLANLNVIAEECRKNRTIVVLCTLPPVCGREEQQARIAQYNPLIRSLARELRDRWEGVFLADLDVAFQTQSVEACALINSHGIHPTRAGYELIAETVYDQLRDVTW